jgi:hypothetical protein
MLEESTCLTHSFVPHPENKGVRDFSDAAYRPFGDWQGQKQIRFVRLSDPYFK